MKTINLILIFLSILIFASCDETTVSPSLSNYERPTASVIPDINLIATNGVSFITDERIIEIPDGSDAITLIFTGSGTPDTTDYVVMASLHGWTGNEWEYVNMWAGQEYIKGYHIESHINRWTKLKLYAIVWHDEIETRDTCILNIENINFN